MGINSRYEYLEEIREGTIWFSNITLATTKLGSISKSMIKNVKKISQKTFNLN